MKKWLFIGLAMILLTGCGKKETFETLSDVYVQPVSAPQVWQLVVDVPQDASVTVMASEESGKLYLCDGYTVTVQTMPAGDLQKTLLTLTGFREDQLTLMQTEQAGVKRYECVWTAAGEGETQIARACLLDDGNYIYAVTAMAGESKTGELAEQWESMFDSIFLASPDAELNTGS